MALKISWTQNYIIFEADLTSEERAWYVRAMNRFGWTKQELKARIAESACENLMLDTASEECYTVQEETDRENTDEEVIICLPREHMNTIAGSLDIAGLFKLTQASLTPD